ncbi:YafY family transcriptional regulator [Massilia sp. PAMC28688]|uniref:helix-turn-helix transcriptional regulator n=1 Tax=Massilia sp. PAMC28688 TaxID=2861283 RepID=UPI001C62FD7F|nr:YafY family protein [Massilia sp. PAMC28688]QYF95501.1 YafY family transcriptional regulator [Massilia sp. PAMC28688]
MSRTNRLFLLMEALRSYRRPVTAAVLAERMQVSERTIYRDIQTLAGLGAPIAGEAGIGYVLRAGMFLPPLMFDVDELEALVLGARWVRQQGDPGLAHAASSALAKIATASPADLRDALADTSLYVPPPCEPAFDAFQAPARQAIRRGRKLRLHYSDEQGRHSERVVWPFALAFFEGRRVLAAWCELRGAIRHFRIDRVRGVDELEESYPARRCDLLARWRRELDLGELS